MTSNFYRRDTCRLCSGKDLMRVLPLSPSALCDAYITKEHLHETQELFPLELFMCRECGYVFLPYVVDPEVIYRDYIYVSTSSMGLADHFGKYAAHVHGRLKLAAGDLAVDIGSNDGTLLQAFKKLGMQVLGVEPAREIAKSATDRGVLTLPEFFDTPLAVKMAREHGKASLITINNLFANIDDLQEVTRGVSELLAPEGVLVIESSYLADMIQNMVFDFAYHEHLSYFSLKPLVSFFRRFGLEVFDVERVGTKGGSMRYYVRKAGGKREVSSAVAELLGYEERLGLYGEELYLKFRERIDDCKKELIELLQRLKSEGKSIAAYGGSATSTTLIYHFGLAPFLEYIVDDNPAKQHTYSPGYHIPVLPSAELYNRKPDCTVVLAWRYCEPIIAKHKAYLDGGGRFLVPIPRMRIIDSAAAGSGSAN
ncbi:class I SAM-dependent methyltransferase [Citrifermentans bremense]|uniref:class I SAM-dependent methyltransferase n=1 Tax=Citrifermentans bremense TaxID=60035 RepID=UPI0004172196|nr:class I SAM-dependent methyltransferase [Citrifermentans bremense]